MKILAYRGKSWISKAIRWQTRSKYSHIGVLLQDGTVIEAWHKGGVRRIPRFSVGHKPGTPIDVFEITAPFEEKAAQIFLERRVGSAYDFHSIFRFLTRRSAAVNDKWFCSELAECAFSAGGLELLNGRPEHHSPRDTVMSPYLRYKETIK